jgi:hypothetical protein
LIFRFSDFENVSASEQHSGGRASNHATQHQSVADHEESESFPRNDPDHEEVDTQLGNVEDHEEGHSQLGNFEDYEKGKTGFNYFENHEERTPVIGNFKVGCHLNERVIPFTIKFL